MTEKPNKLFALILDENLSAGFALNAASHMSAQFGSIAHEIKGTTIVDRSGFTHPGLPIYGNVILSCPPQELKTRLDNARNISNGNDTIEPVLIVDFTEEGFTTATDEELVQELSQKHETEINYRGFLLYGNKGTVRKITKGLSLWK